MRLRLSILLFLAGLVLACSDVSRVVQVVPLETEIVASQAQPTPAVVAQQQEPEPTLPPPPTPTPLPTFTPTPTSTPIPRPFLAGLSTTPSQTLRDKNLPLARHGLWIALFLPLVLFGIPWSILEIIVARYVQPRSNDLARVLIKAQDGLFINAIVSMTARKTLSLVSLTIRWNRVSDVVEKAVEQELIHEALNYTSLLELENGLKEIAERFTKLPIIAELSRDFGVEVLRFNIEIQYPSETVDALNRTAEASAGGQAYIAYARAARLDPESAEARTLYEVFQKTSSQVDAARNLGGGISGLANLLNQNKPRQKSEDGNEADE